MSYINLCPTELKKEMVKYCIYFACILDKTGLFEVPKVVSKASRLWLIGLQAKTPGVRMLNNFLLLKKTTELGQKLIKVPRRQFLLIKKK